MSSTPLAQPITTGSFPKMNNTAYVGVLISIRSAINDYFARNGRNRCESQQKDDIHDRLTEHDIAVQQLICDKIKTKFPTSTFLCEEKSELMAKRPGQPRWIIDPIDGTANFASGMPLWATSIAVDIDGEIQAAMIYAPFIGETYLADSSSLYRQRLAISQSGLGKGEWEKVELLPDDSAFLALSSIPNAGGWSHYPGTSEFEKDIKTHLPSKRGCGSAALELAWTASGDASAAYNLLTKPWDSAAGVHMTLCAGGSFWGWPQGEQDPFRDEPWYCRSRYLAISGRCSEDDPFATLLVDRLSQLIGCQPDLYKGAYSRSSSKENLPEKPSRNQAGLAW